MRHRKKGTTLGREKGPREMLLRNLTASVLMYETVTTTEAKARAVRPLVEKMITFAKKGDLSARRELIKFLPQKLAVKKAMDVLGDRYKDREGGYTRLVKLGTRPGDGAKKVQIQLV